MPLLKLQLAPVSFGKHGVLRVASLIAPSNWG